MNDYILLMHDDAPSGDGARRTLGPRTSSSSGKQACSRVAARSAMVSALRRRSRYPVSRDACRDTSEFVRSTRQARGLVNGNPVFEAGGTVEIRELPRS